MIRAREEKPGISMYQLCQQQILPTGFSPRGDLVPAEGGLFDTQTFERPGE